MIIAPANFRDEELFHPKAEFENAGFKVDIASKIKNPTGMLGAKVNADLLLDEINITDYNAIIFVGGSGTVVYFNDKQVQNIAKEAAQKCKVLAAICIAPSILANSGLLKGKKATSFPSEAENLKAKGAIYTGKPVEEDILGDFTLITGRDPASAKEFGKLIVKKLKK